MPAAIVLIIIAVIVLCYRSHIAQAALCGFWQADKSFCGEAGLDYFCMYIGPADWLGNRACYILAGNNGADAIINEAPVMRATVAPTCGPFASSIMRMNIKFIGLNTPLLTDRQQLVLYPCGKLIMYDGDTVSAALYKNAQASEHGGRVK